MKIEQLLDTVASVMVDRAPEVVNSTLKTKERFDSFSSLCEVFESFRGHDIEKEVF